MNTESWVAGHLSGGLGNRLFQHASAAGLAENLGRPVVFHLPSCAYREHGPIENIFRLFPDTPVVVEDAETVIIREPPDSVFKYCPFPDLRSLKANILIDGFRQSPLYFPKKGIHVALESTIEETRKTQLVQRWGLETQDAKRTSWFLHVRLGDYTKLPHHQINMGAYYKEAVKHIPSGEQILVFSDQALEYKERFEAIFASLGHTVRIVTDVTDELETLFLMSQCWAGAIVANSTFSWWGCYFARQRCLNPEAYKGVFPVCWGQGLPPAQDLLPAWAIRIEL